MRLFYLSYQEISPTASAKSETLVEEILTTETPRHGQEGKMKR